MCLTLVTDHKLENIEKLMVAASEVDALQSLRLYPQVQMLLMTGKRDGKRFKAPALMCRVESSPKPLAI